MISITVDDFDLGQIAESGQCFRMNYIGKGSYSIIQIMQKSNAMLNVIHI